MSKVQEFMTSRPLTVPVGESLSAAYKIMAENKIRHLPVIDTENRVVGVLSSKDFPPFGELRDGRVEYYMNAPVLHIQQDESLKEAVYRMLQKKVSSLIVTDENKNIRGIITTDDLLFYLIARLEKDSVDSQKSIFSWLFDKETIGKVAHQISLAGI